MSYKKFEKLAVKQGRTFTKRQALWVSCLLWLWLSKNPAAEKFEWPGWKRLQKHNRRVYGQYNLSCPCCHYVKYLNASCDECPLYGYWPFNKNCLSSLSPYQRWKKAKTLRFKQHYAKQMFWMSVKGLGREIGRRILYGKE
jgi:hypothetical protein